MAITLKKNTVDVSYSIDWPTLSLKQVLTKEVGQLFFTIKNSPGKATCVSGDQIDLYEDSTHIFGGTVTDIQNIVEGGILIASKITANDWSFRLNSKLVVQTYEGMDPGDIVLDILSQFTDGTYTTTNVQMAGWDLTSIKFNYEQVTSSIEKLAKQIGWEWYVDADKDVHFFPPDTVVTAPFTIDDTSGKLEWPTLEVEEDIQNMKNSIFVVGGTYTKDFDDTDTPDVYLTDGTKSVFPIAYAYTAATIVVTLAGVSQTIGTDQRDNPASFQVMYNEGNRFIVFNSVPTTGQEVKVYGTAQIPIVAHVSDQTAIAAYGEIQDVIIDKQIKSFEEAQERGNAQIAQYGSPVNIVRFSTLQTGLVIGQTLQINSTIFGVDINVIVKNYTATMSGPNRLRYEVECVGTERVSFIDIMKVLMLQANESTVVDDNTVLQVLSLFNEEIAVADTLGTPTTTTGPYKWGVDAAAKTWNFFTFA